MYLYKVLKWIHDHEGKQIYSYVLTMCIQQMNSIQSMILIL